MEESISSTDTTNPTRLAMILTLVIVIKEITNQACVTPKSNSTIATIHLHFLPRIALGAYQLSDGLSIECVILHFVMTIPADVNFSTTWTLRTRQ
jgi:hypothetical protein